MSKRLYTGISVPKDGDDDDNAKTKFYKPLSSDTLARPAGIPSMMRLPVLESTKGLDACFVGVPLDNGTSHRTGSRFGPRQLRVESAIMREFNAATGADPFNSIKVADVGDVWVNLYNLPDACKKIKDSFADIIKHGCIPIIAGGDHTITYPIMQALASKYGPLGLIHIDAHIDCSLHMLGERIAHGTPIGLAIEENLIDTSRVYQIGQRGPSYSPSAYKAQKQRGFNIVPAHEIWHKSLAPIMEDVRRVMGDGPVFIALDVDALDPAYAPGTGMPEIGGLTTIQVLEIIRGCKGLNLVGSEIVEFSPQYDLSGATAITVVNLLFEMLCVLPGVMYHK